MIEWIGKSANITIKKDDKNLFFTAKMILSIDSEHITFLDKFNQPYTFHKSLVEEIQPMIIDRNENKRN